MICPQCKTATHVEIEATTTSCIQVDREWNHIGDEEWGGWEWENGSAAYCGECGWQGIVQDLIEPDEEEDSNAEDTDRETTEGAAGAEGVDPKDSGGAPAGVDCDRAEVGTGTAQDPPRDAAVRADDAGTINRAMLEALKSIVECCDDGDADILTREAARIAKRAIAQAEGRNT